MSPKIYISGEYLLGYFAFPKTFHLQVQVVIGIIFLIIGVNNVPEIVYPSVVPLVGTGLHFVCVWIDVVFLTGKSRMLAFS